MGRGGLKVERLLAKQEIAGSNPVPDSISFNGGNFSG